MINLIPDNDKLKLKKEYRLRVFTVGMIFAFFLTIVVIIVMLPSYLLSSARQQGVKEKITTQNNNQGTEHKTLLDNLASIKTSIDALKSDQPNITATKLITYLVQDRGTGCKISSILYSKDDKGNIKMTVQGIAKTRESLLAFTQTVQKEYAISKVNLPISNFTKDTDIQYSFDIEAR